jgi:hypothetical protein
LDLIEAQVQTRLNGRVQYFRLQAVEDGLVLRGRSRTYYAKQLAQHAVMTVTRIAIVANRIEVV